MSRPPRLHPEAYLGFREYFLTLCTDERQPHFVTHTTVDEVSTHFLRTAEEQGLDIVVHCFMPDHLHLLAVSQVEAADLRRFVLRAKQFTAYHFRRREKKRLWQEGFYDRVLRKDEDRADVIRYVVENPLRAGLAASVVDYPYWGSGRYSREHILEFLGRPCRT